MAQGLRVNKAKQWSGHFQQHSKEEDSAVEKKKPLAQQNKQGQQHKPKESKRPKDQAQTPAGGPGERSDEESIGRPVQLDKK
jgi:hypothetical protein